MITNLMINNIIYKMLIESDFPLIFLFTNYRILFFVATTLILLAVFTFLLILAAKRKKAKSELEISETRIHELSSKIENIESHVEEKVKERTKELEIELDEQRQFEDALNDALEKAKEANFLKDSFLSNLSFGMRTPMNAIIGYSELINDPASSLEQKENYIDTIRNSCKLLVNIINDVLDMSDIEAGQIKVNQDKFSINKLLDDIFSFFNSEKNITNKEHIKLYLTKDLKAEESIISSDSTKIQQILTQLISNSFKFTEKGSIEFGYTIKDNRLIQFYVKDTGQGLTKDEQEMIFEKYVLVEKPGSRVTRDSGLGLAIAKGYVELMGGKIWVESIENKGTTFYFTIPYNKITPTKEKKENQITGDNNWEDKTILVVEDDTSSSRFLQAILKKTGARLVFTDDGEKAVDLCKNDKNIDLVLMDVQLPTLSGYEATRKIKEFRPDMDIIAQTANAFADERAKALEAGCTEYVTKPINKDKLFQVMKDVFTKNSL